MSSHGKQAPVDIGASGRYEPTVTHVLDDLFALVNERAYAEGEFTLASGRKSRYYFDGKLVVFDQLGARLFAGWLLARISELKPRPVAVGGLEIGAIPIACTATALASFPLAAFVVRKQPKSHGTSKWIEGPIKAGDDVVVVDDVITTGESTLKAVRAVRDLGANVRGVFCLVDRQEGHSDEFDKLQRETHFEAAFTLNDFLRRRRERK
jgi:orotate phosphoribosyltransferase